MNNPPDRHRSLAKYSANRPISPSPATDADRKQLIRHLVEEVRVTVAGTSETMDVEVTWVPGTAPARRSPAWWPA